MLLADWSTLPDDQQLALSRAALRRTAEILADQAEVLAVEMEDGLLSDNGGSEALRLLAMLIRASSREGLSCVGHA